MGTNITEIPKDVLAEQSVIGAMLLDQSVIGDVFSACREDYFYLEKHRLIYRAIGSLYEEGQEVDLVTVVDKLRVNGNLARAGEAVYLIGLMEGQGTAAFFQSYVDIVVEKARLRNVIEWGRKITSSAYDNESVEEVLATAEDDLLKLRRGVGTKDNWVSASEVGEMLELRQRDVEEGRGVKVLKSGFPLLDGIISGFADGNLNIVAARPSMGKTAFAMSLVLELCGQKSHKVEDEQRVDGGCRVDPVTGEIVSSFVGDFNSGKEQDCNNSANGDFRECIRHEKYESEGEGVRVMVFSLEMTREELGMRLLSQISRLDLKKVKEGKISQGERGHFSEGVEKVKGLELLIDDDSGITVDELQERATRAAIGRRIDAVIVDYLQLVEAPARHGDSREREISYIARSLKKLAGKLAVPVIALSQLSRKPEGRPDKRPILSDLRDSGGIEQDADIVMFLYRDEYYNPKSDSCGEAEVLVRKNRDGPLGTAKLGFMPSQARFFHKLA